jgi:hypothetical protein
MKEFVSCVDRRGAHGFGMKPLLAVLLPVLLLASPAFAKPAKPPQQIVDAVREAMGDGDGPSPKIRPGMFNRVDINQDGVADWVVDFSQDQGWCGSGGCWQSMWVSRPGGTYREVFNQQTQSWKISHRHGRTELDVDVYGDFCNRAGVQECLRRFVWDEATVRFVEVINGKGENWLHGPLFQVIDAEEPVGMAPDDRPGCPDRGDTYGGDTASSPDLDGDGARDIVRIDAACGDDLPARVRVLASSVGFATVLLVEGDDYEVDIASTPAVLRAPTPDCADKTQCKLTPYRWDATKRLLAPAAP